MKLRLILLGKTRRPELRALLDDYLSRIRHHAEIELTELRDSSPAALRKLKVEPSSTVVLLDASSHRYTSEQFARWLGTHRDSGTRELVFLCGDASGFPDSLRRRATTRLALSSLTFSHELARVILAEQLYRAFAILSGSPYPK